MNPTPRLQFLAFCGAALVAVYFVPAASAAEPNRAHSIELHERVLAPEEGLLLGNGDLSASVYQSANGIVWRLGKPDVWDRRLDLSEDPKPADIDEIAQGIKVEGWKCGPYGGPVEATHGTPNPQRMRDLCQGSPPSYKHRPYPCPKPVGELTLHLPPDLPGMKIQQRLAIEEASLAVVCTWPSGAEIRIDSFIHPVLNVLVLHWKTANWTDKTRTGNKPPMWFSLARWPDPPIRAFAAKFFGDSRQGAFRDYSSPKATPLAPPAVKQDGGVWLIEQAFSPDPLFPKGFRCVMAPLAPRAAIEPVEMATAGEARLHVLPADAAEGWLALPVATSSDLEGPLASLHRVRGLLADPPVALAQWSEENRKQAAEFWAKSRVRIADPLLENLWYETLHARRCTYRRGVTPPGLFLPSTVQDYSHWHGDYHTNYNIQEPFWGDYTANHAELGDAYFDGVKFMLPIGRKIARDYYHCRGVFIQLSMYPIQPEDDPLGVAPMGRMAYMTGWTANQYWWRYLYTLDKQWLHETGYPVIRDCALFYTDFLRKGEDGLYHIFPSNQGEDGFSGNPKDYTDRAQVMQHMRYCLHAAIGASEALGADEELRAAWRERLEHASGDEGRPPLKLAGLERLCYEANPPEFGFGRPWRPQPANPEGSPWPAVGSAAHVWYFGQYPWGVMGRLRSGEFIADRDLPVFRSLVERWRRPNGLIWGMAVANYGRAGAWTESLGVIAPLQEMMLQSWDGALRIFPAWPRNLDAEFDALRAEGALLVSAAWSDGRVTSLEIRSEKGAPCRLYSPWPTSGIRVADEAGREVPVDADPYGRPGFATRPGAKYTVRPRS
jgi:hypothetical protein